MRKTIPAAELTEIAAAAARDSGGLPAELLGDFLEVITEAVLEGAPLTSRQLRSYRAHGDRAARQGVALRALLDLYTSAAWRLWRHLPPVVDAARAPARVVVAGEVMLRGVDDVVASLAEGFQLARRALERAQESTRREFIDDLLTGGVDVAGVLRRADGFGLDLSGPHAVVTVRADRVVDDANPLLRRMERAISGAKGDASALLASKEGRLVAVFAAPDREAITHVVTQLQQVLEAGGRRAGFGHWQLAVGRTGPGVDGVLASYRDCLDALDLAERLGLDSPVIDARELRVYQVLLRDRDALAELVEDTLAPLRTARGGAGPLLETLAAYFAVGGNAAHAARRLHLSVRAVTYRLDRIARLTGLDPDDADDRFTLHVAVLGARLLDWLTAGSD